MKEIVRNILYVILKTSCTIKDRFSCEASERPNPGDGTAFSQSEALGEDEFDRLQTWIPVTHIECLFQFFATILVALQMKPPVWKVTHTEERGRCCNGKRRIKVSCGLCID